MFIERGVARIIRNSRREKTVEISFKTHIGTFVSSAPSGKSKGKSEVPDYNERGIGWSTKLANDFLRRLTHKNVILKDISELAELEKRIKEYERDFGKLGGNVVYAIETALLKACAKENKKQLWEFVLGSKNHKKINFPMPVGNCIGGGLHSAGVKGKKPDFQEFLLIPKEETFSKAVSKNIHAYFYAKRLVKKKQRSLFMKGNDESAWNTGLSNEETLQVLSEVASKYSLRIGLDVASSSFCDNKGYYQYQNKKLIRDRTEQVEYMTLLAKKFNIFYLEDPLMEDDFSGFKELSENLKNTKTMVVGDDLTTTNPKRVERAFRANSISAMIVKPNQIGSLIEVKKVMDFCKKNKIKTIFSHRSGETMDDALADYAVGFQADFIKTGIFGKERLVKLRRVMEIEKSVSQIKYPGV